MSMFDFRECARCISASCAHYRRCRYHELMAYRRDSGSGPKGENSRSEVEGEARQPGPRSGIAQT